MTARIVLGMTFAAALVATAAAQGPRPWAGKVPRETARMKNPLPQNAETVAAGKIVYTNTCMPCHGELAQGDGPAAQFINPKPKPLVNGTALSLPDGVIFWVISNGIDNTGMAAFKETMPENERWQAVAYLHTLKEGQPQPTNITKVTTTSGGTAPVAP